MKLPGPVALLDGSMGQELVNRGAGGDGLLWAAGLLVCHHPPSRLVDGVTITGEQTFSACEEMTVRNSQIVGPSGDGTFEAADGVAFDNGFSVAIDGRMSASAGRSIYKSP